LTYGVLAAFVILVTPIGLVAQAQTPAQSASLAGFIYAKDMKTPVAGAIVKIRNLADQKELASMPADANGMYMIAGIPEGRYILGVTSAEGNFDFDYALNVKAGELGKLSVALAPGAVAQTSGEAATKKTGFFSTLAGRALLVTAVGVAVYFIFFNEKEGSPIR
jgi:hypothetical protein